MNILNPAYVALLQRIDAAAKRAGHSVRLLAVSKTKPAAALRDVAAGGQRAFGENYVQEAIAKQRELADLHLEWHLIGPLQSNKCRDASRHFDWLQTLDREKLIAPLNRFRPADASPLNVLIQVNIDDEASKSGCAPDAVRTLANAIAAAPRLRLRGLMAIPEPSADREKRRRAFQRMRALFDGLRADHAAIDTLSMGMSDDFELAIAEGATMVRIGTAVFGARRRDADSGNADSQEPQ
jgi:pyridoxal phosphate enzyme (YggS family)